MTLDPEVRDLLAALENLDARTRDLPDGERSQTLAFLGGVMRAVLHEEAELRHATATLTAWPPVWERAAGQATKAGR